MSMPNPGFDPKEIEELKQECIADKNIYVVFEDEDEHSEDEDDLLQFVHFQFVGKHETKEVIYDAVLCTLRLNHSSLVYEEAEKQAQKLFPTYVPFEERKPSYKVDEESELFVQELMEQIEEDESVKVAESFEIDHDFEYGIGLDIALNVEEIDDDVIRKFITEFNAGTFKLDPTLYSFKTEEEE